MWHVTLVRQESDSEDKVNRAAGNYVSITNAPWLGQRASDQMTKYLYENLIW